MPAIQKEDKLRERKAARELAARQAIADRAWYAKQTPEMQLHHKLGKRYKIRNGQVFWINLTDKQRAERLKKYVDHFFRVTGVKITPVVQGPEFRPPYAVSFLEPGGAK